MPLSTQRHHDYITAATREAIAFDEQPSRYWVLSLIATSTAIWMAIFGAAKLLLVLI